MVALSDLINLRDRRRRETVQLLEISSLGFRALSAKAPLAGAAIRIEIPALGALDGRVTWAKDGEFGAEFCGVNDLRLLFLRKSVVDWTSWIECSVD